MHSFDFMVMTVDFVLLKKGEYKSGLVAQACCLSYLGA